MSTKAMLAIIAMISTAMAQNNFTENSVTVPSGKSLDMIFVEGGTFQMGCSGRSNPSCGPNEGSAHSVTLDDYYIGKYEVTRAQWRAVMGDDTPSMMFAVADSNDIPINTIDWYYANEFVCALNEKTGKKYRLATEAEWEFAARGGKKSKGTAYSGSANADDVAWHSGSTFPPIRICMEYNGRPFCTEMNMQGGTAQLVGGKTPNELGIYDMSGNVREWTYDSFSQSYSSGAVTNPTGPAQLHTQKIRRGGSYMVEATNSTVTARLIRSIEGADGDLGFRLALSKNQNTIPANMVAPCDIHSPPVSHGKGTLRDDRLITADGEVWANGSAVLIVKENGAAVMKPSFGSSVSGEWATANDFALYITNSSGTPKKYIYYIKSETDMSLMEDNGMPGRWERRPASEVSGASSITVPTIANPKQPNELIPAGAIFNMNDPPTNGKDQRLIVAQSLGTGNAWVQDNVAIGAGGYHRYRFDYTPDTARFVVWDVTMNSSVTISAGKWFTLDNTFLRIIGSNGRRYDYLYTVTANGNTHYHISFQGYERGDFRMFEKMAVANVPQWKEPTMDPYATNKNGGSTYLPPDSVEAQVVVSSSSARSSSSREGSSSSSKESSSSSSRESSSSSAETTSLLPQIAVSNQAVQVKNGVNLQVVKGATVEIYNIRGNLVNRQNYTGGVHSISLSHLPKGIYVVKVRFGSDVKILRMPVM